MSDSDLSRRNFIRSGAAAAALAAGAKFAFAAEPSASKDKPAGPPKSREERRAEALKKPLPTTTPSKYTPIRVAHIGIGGQGGHDLAMIVKSGATIAAICDVDENTLNKRGEELPNAKRYTDYRELMDKEANNIDAVVVATPDHNHAAATMLAIKAGKHVYCEKPLTYDIHEARVVAEAARKAGVKTQMGNQGSANDNMRRQVEWVRSGMVGNIKEVHVYTNRPIWPQGLVKPTSKPPIPPTLHWDNWLGPAPYRDYNPVYQPFNWRGWWDFGTGALGDMACHLTNTAYWALDLSNPAVTEAFQNGRTIDSPPYWSVIKWEFPELNGRPAVKMFWYDGGMMPPHTLMGKKKDFPGDNNGVVFVGEKGTIAAAYMGEPFLVDEEQQKSVKQPDQTIPRVHAPEGHSAHHEEWLDAILGGPPAASNFDHAGPMTETVLVGNLAVRTGHRIEWDSKKMKVLNDKDAQKYVKRDYRKGWSL